MMLNALHVYTQKKAKPQEYFRAENRDIWVFFFFFLLVRR